MRALQFSLGFIKIIPKIQRISMICVSRVFTKIASTSSPASWQDHVTNFHLTWPTRRPQNNKYLHGRPGPRMWCPHVIGRDGWVWVEQRALRKRKFPPQGGGERPDWRGATRRENSTSGVRVWVIVVVECYCYLKNIIVEPFEPSAVTGTRDW